MTFYFHYHNKNVLIWQAAAPPLSVPLTKHTLSAEKKKNKYSKNIITYFTVMHRGL